MNFKFKSLLLVLAFWSLPSFPGGIGGYEGGSILFQRESTFVNAAYSSTLCLNRADVYEAVVHFCESQRTETESCRQLVRKRIFQPRVSTRLICADRSLRDGESCPQYTEVPFVQERERYLVRRVDSRVVEERTFVIPYCN